MDRLWAPWRAPYILKDLKKKKKGCVFCKAFKEHCKGKSNQVIEVSEHSFSVLNIYPYNNGHMMILPIRHEGDLARLTSAELEDVMELLRRSQACLKRVLRPEGFNIGMNLGREAGAGVADHLHFHLVPRWRGDTNFMTLFSGTRVISQSLDDLRKRLLDDIKKRDRRKRR
jgi:ATP adenylyltransferase